MHFTVKTKHTDPETGLTSFVISYDLGNGEGEKTDPRGNCNPDLAEAYIKSMQRGYLAKMFELYVNHAVKVFENSQQAYYHEPKRVNILERCKKAVKVISDETTLEIVAGYIVSSEPLLRYILPHYMNTSFYSSEERINVMMQIAHPIAKPDQLLKKLNKTT